MDVGCVAVVGVPGCGGRDALLQFEGVKVVDLADGVHAFWVEFPWKGLMVGFGVCLCGREEWEACMLRSVVMLEEVATRGSVVWRSGMSMVGIQHARGLAAM